MIVFEIIFGLVGEVLVDLVVGFLDARLSKRFKYHQRWLRRIVRFILVTISVVFLLALVLGILALLEIAFPNLLDMIEFD